MKHHPGLLLALIGLVLTTGLLLAIAARGHAGQNPVYSVAATQAHLAEDPQRWIGRIVRLRGRAEGCLAARGAPPGQSCGRWPAYLLDASIASAPGGLLLAWGSQDAVPAFLHRVPLLSALIPPPPTPRWGALATYRVRLQAAACGVAPCYEGVVLDAAP